MRWPWQHADPEEILELEAENTLLGEYIDSDGEIPYPDLNGNDRKILAERELEEANARAQNFVQKVEPFNVEMQPLSPPPKKKREFFKPPILDGHYFDRKRREREEATVYRSASVMPYGGASYYGGGTYVALGRGMEMQRVRQYECEEGHIVLFGSDRCINCGRASWE